MSANGGRGPYLTESRTIALEQKIATIEQRLNERIDRLEASLAAQVTTDVIRLFTAGVMKELRDTIVGG